VTFDLDRHPNTLIIGENGSGKSTVLDALTFSLFGKPFRKVNKPQLVNTVNDGECVAEINFTIGSKLYFIRRGIKPNIFDILVDGQPLNQSANVRDFQELLEKQILKLNYKSFTQVVVLGSSTFVPFMQLSAANRREVIEDLLDIQIFSSMNTILKQKISTTKDSLSENSTNLSLNQQLVDVQSKNLDRIKRGNKKIIDKHTSDINLHVKENKNRLNGIASFNSLIKSLELKTTDSAKDQRKLKDAEKIDSKLHSKENILNKEIVFYGDHDDCPTCEQDIEPDFKTKIVATKKGKLNEVESARSEIGKFLDDLNNEISANQKIVDQISSTRSEISILGTNITATNQIIKSLERSIEGLSTTGDANKIKEEIDGANDILHTLELDKEGLVNENETQKIATSLLKDSGIKTLIIKQYLPIMNKLVNKYLASMDFFVNFNLDENFDETIKSRYRDEFSYASFSEGEKMRIDLALLFTWRAIAKLKNSTNTNLLILDEVFDSSLDDAGTQEFLKILYTLGTDQNVFVISHKGDVLQDKFNNIIRFDKVRGFSRIL
jgi:DNA repair exonuclease SbcCD ATPase subunit